MQRDAFTPGRRPIAEQYVKQPQSTGAATPSGDLRSAVEAQWDAVERAFRRDFGKSHGGRAVTALDVAHGNETEETPSAATSQAVRTPTYAGASASPRGALLRNASTPSTESRAAVHSIKEPPPDTRPLTGPHKWQITPVLALIGLIASAAIAAMVTFWLMEARSDRRVPADTTGSNASESRDFNAAPVPGPPVLPSASQREPASAKTQTSVLPAAETHSETGSVIPPSTQTSASTVNAIDALRLNRKEAASTPADAGHDSTLQSADTPMRASPLAAPQGREDTNLAIVSRERRRYTNKRVLPETSFKTSAAQEQVSGPAEGPAYPAELPYRVEQSSAGVGADERTVQPCDFVRSILGDKRCGKAPRSASSRRGYRRASAADGSSGNGLAGTVPAASPATVAASVPGISAGGAGVGATSTSTGISAATNAGSIASSGSVTGAGSGTGGTGTGAPAATGGSGAAGSSVSGAGAGPGAAGGSGGSAAGSGNGGGSGPGGGPGGR